MDIKSITLDLETEGLDRFKDPITVMSYQFNGKGPVYTIEWNGKLPLEVALALGDKNVTKRGHNIKFDLLFLAHNGFTVDGILDDTRILYYLQNPFDSVGLKDLVESKLKRKVKRLEDIVFKLKKKDPTPEGTVWTTIKGSSKKHPVLLKDLIPYNQADVTNCDDLRKQAVVTGWYKSVEQPLTKILFDTENRGIQLNIPYLKELKKEHEIKLEELKASLGLGTTTNKKGEVVAVNPRSPKQVKAALKTKDTEELTLKRLVWAGRTELKPILDYRKFDKLYGTYTVPLLEKADATGRIHGSFNQAGSNSSDGGTKTGRLTSSEPNLQNIPSRTVEGKKIRKAFIPTSGFILVDSDLRQIEPRLVAHYSQSPKLIKAFGEGLDTHGLMACGIFGKSRVEDLTKMERFIGKTGWLATVYGCYYKKLRDIVDKNSDEDPKYDEDFYKDFQAKFWKDNPEIGQWRRWHIESTRRCGYITTIGGRIVKIPGLNSRNPSERNEAERMAVNYLVQGSAADIMKMGIVNLSKLPCNLLATVHDEVLCEFPKCEEWDEDYMIDSVTMALTQTVKLKNVLIEADTKIINNWGDKQ